VDLTIDTGALDLDPGGVGIGASASAPLDPPRVSGNADQGKPVARSYQYGHSTPWAQASLRRLGYPGH
jgi:hypothetical protein